MIMTIRWNGRNAEDALNKAAFPQIRDNFAAHLRSIRCPEHGTGPTAVTVSGHDLKSLKWEIQGCCPKLVEAIKRELGSSSR
jgi:hypothetical protein